VDPVLCSLRRLLINPTFRDIVSLWWRKSTNFKQKQIYKVVNSALSIHWTLLHLKRKHCVQLKFVLASSIHERWTIISYCLNLKLRRWNGRPSYTISSGKPLWCLRLSIMMIDVLRPLVCTWAEPYPNVTERSQRWNTLQIWPGRDSTSGGNDLWSKALPTRPRRPPTFVGVSRSPA